MLRSLVTQRIAQGRARLIRTKPPNPAAATPPGPEDAYTYAPFPLRGLPFQVGVAMGVASFWRGAWYVMDGTIFPENLALSGATSLALGTGGLAALQHQVAPRMLAAANAGALPGPLARGAAVYGLGLSCVAIWRGAWVLWDAAYEYITKESALDRPIRSGLPSHVAGLGALALAGHATACLSPPVVACIFTDRPGLWAAEPGPFLRGSGWFFRRLPRG